MLHPQVDDRAQHSIKRRLRPSGTQRVTIRIRDDRVRVRMYLRGIFAMMTYNTESIAGVEIALQ